MAKTTPVVDHGLLMPPAAGADPVAVGTPAWYAWLADAHSFAFRSASGSFTAARERRGTARVYWKAYRRRDGVLQRAYLGKSDELTLDRLEAVAAELAQRLARPAPTSRPHKPASREQQHSTERRVARAPLAPDDARPLHLLATKLTIPGLRSNLVPRAQLIAQLDAAINQHKRLILLTAPAGFGKTTLLTAWLNRSIAPSVAWLTLDDTDNHLGQFLAGLIAALETVRPGVGTEGWRRLRAEAAHPPCQLILSSLLNALTATPTPLVLVLEDYHTITLQVIHEAVAFLIDRMPEHTSLIITTRADPPLQLARLRARGHIAEIRAADLRFTTAEAQQLFRQVPGLQLAPEAVGTLMARTEGWATGLQLAAHALQQQTPDVITFITNFSGSHRYVFDYLADEIFQRQPVEVQTFLIQTSILSRLCGNLCAAVTGHDDAQEVLEYLDRTNIFLIPLDDRREWYRYHNLFRDFLRHGLNQTHAVTERAALHLRASTWFEQQSLITEAIEHALAAQAWHEALRILAPLLANQQLLYAYYLDWPRWLEALPDSALAADPDMCMRFAWALIVTGHARAAERALARAEAAWSASKHQAKLGEILCYRALAAMFTGDLQRMCELAQQVLTSVPDTAQEPRAIATWFVARDRAALGHIGEALEGFSATYAALIDASEPFAFFARAAATSVAWGLHLQGHLQEAAALYRDLIRRANDATHQQQLLIYSFLGQVYYELNDLEAAEQMLREGIAVGRRTGRERYWPAIYADLARVLWARGDTEAARAAIAQALDTARSLANPAELRTIEVHQMRIQLAQGDLAAAQRWVAARNLAPDDPITYEQQPEYLLLARLRLAQAQGEGDASALAPIVQMLEWLEQRALTDTRMLDRLSILVLIALMLATCGEQHAAIERLAGALQLAAPEGCIRTFVDEGPAMHALISAYRRQLAHAPADHDGEASDMLRYLDRLLAAFRHRDASYQVQNNAPGLLSARERAVLALLAEGRPVREVAELLVISPHTTRTHIKNIYAKLDVHSRIQAVERARDLQIL